MIRNGIDRADLPEFLNPEWKIAMLTNHSATARDLRPSRKILNDAHPIEFLLAPEHGIFGAEQAGGGGHDTHDPVTGAPCRSTYGAGNAMTAETVAGLDALIYDLQDVGSRFYTYLYTMSDAMALCAECGVRFIVLDRIDPINGINTEGIRIEEDCASFVGRYGVPARYALTVGEFARMVKTKIAPECELTVVPCTGWTRGMEFEETGLCWVNPSPNLVTPDAARIYCGTCIFEGTNISEGRGTTHPFEMIGAPFLDTGKCLAKLAKYRLPGVLFRECRFLPVFGKFKDELCSGIQIHITDRKQFNGFETGFRLFQAIRETTGEFRFNVPPETPEALTHFDTLLGTQKIRCGGLDPDDFILRARRESAEFQREAKQYQLY